MTQSDRVPARAQLALFLLLLATYGYFIQPPGANALSRFDLVRALVDDRSLAIDRYHQNTVDKGFVNGHYYSDKAFGLSLVAAPVYAALRSVDRWERIEARDEQLTIHLLTFLTVSVPSALLAVLVARAAGALGSGAAGALGAGVAYGLGTIAFPFSTLFFGHQTASFAAFAAALLLISLRRGSGERRGGFQLALSAGLLAGFAAIVEYPAGLVAVLLGGYVWAFVPGRRHFVAFFLGIVTSLLALALYNLVAFGDVWRVSYVFVNDERFAQAHRGLMGVSWPDAHVALRLLFGGNGLLVNAPILALTPLGLWRLWRQRHARPEALLFVAIGGAFLVYNAGYYLPFGGWTPGPRFLLPALPFLAVPLAATFARPRWLRPLSSGLCAWSILVMFLATATTPLVSDTKGIPLLDMWVPNLVRGDLVYNLGLRYLGLHGVASLLPLLAALVLAVLADRFLSRFKSSRPAARSVALLAVAPIVALVALPLSLPFDRGTTATADPAMAVNAITPTELGVLPGMGQAVSIAIQNGPAPARNVALWLAVADDAGTTRHEDWFYPLNIEPNQERLFTFRWTVPPDEIPGERRLTATVLHHSWSYHLARNEGAISFAVLADGR